MASRKNNAVGAKTASLPTGFTKLAQQLTWDPLQMPLLVGTIVGFGAAPAKNFGDGNWFPGKQQRFVKIAPQDGDGNTVYIVYEGGSLSVLLDEGEGVTVAIAFTGTERVEGFKNPVKRYEVGVME